MRTVYKYPVPVADEVRIDMPFGAKVLHVEQQGEGVYIWALVDPSAERERRVFIVRGTGHPIDDDMPIEHVGTFLLQGGALVFHLFEVLIR